MACWDAASSFVAAVAVPAGNIIWDAGADVGGGTHESTRLRSGVSGCNEATVEAGVGGVIGGAKSETSLVLSEKHDSVADEGTLSGLGTSPSAIRSGEKPALKTIETGRRLSAGRTSRRAVGLFSCSGGIDEFLGRTGVDRPDRGASTTKLGTPWAAGRGLATLSKREGGSASAPPFRTTLPIGAETMDRTSSSAVGSPVTAFLRPLKKPLFLDLSGFWVLGPGGVAGRSGVEVWARVRLGRTRSPGEPGAWLKCRRLAACSTSRMLGCGGRSAGR